ncbi:Neutral endopeptidase [Metamycoplasma arthritidis]|uniref:Endopeptidase O n=1 Tax=Metamycoplasma arthritidis (strain 158L3-1) TaxID=243272 RepID=B3PNG3_META1|nr:M13 family metallopeptidase [Metamycoplasma arthritidis]ACF07565.1 endopeptidase O [Metamycoplasma arthritidis 158L3-1]VEU79073.1 Neutral endopeptidase [Metamycoplasma arthritidis]
MNKELIKKDFYEAVNGSWLSTHKIPNDRVGWGSFYEIDEKLTKLKSKLINDWKENPNLIKDQPILVEMVSYYKLLSDWESRKKNGMKPLKPLLKKISSLKKWEDLEKNYREFTYLGLMMPLGFSVSPDFKDSEKQIVWLEDAQIILPEKGYYDDKEKSEALLNTYATMVEKLLRKLRINKDKIKKLIDETFEFDRLCVEFALSAEEGAEFTKLYNMITTEEAQKSINVLNINKILQALVGQEVFDFSAVSPKFVSGLNKLYNENTFNLYRSALFVNAVVKFAPFLDDDARKISSIYRMAISGITKFKDKKKVAIDTAIETFSIPFGLYYGEIYFGKEAKEDVEHMIKSMIAIYKKRLENNSWLSKETKEKAIVKLNKMELHVGYPEKIQTYYRDMRVKEYEGYNDLLLNTFDFISLAKEYDFKKYLKPVDRKLWSMSPAVVNAYFSPNNNHIVFPAAILNKPFYGSKNSSVNYGGIGTVIAHEISHAFDNNGANFDENGNMINWWTEEDKKNFENKAKDMIALFNGKTIEAGKCNGKLTVSENIADAGGVSCAYEAASLEKDFDPKKFYENFATIWRTKYRPQFAQMLLNIDVHAPVKLRANIQIQNSDGFYKAYDISPEDPMYLAPEKRVKIW